MTFADESPVFKESRFFSSSVANPTINGYQCALPIAPAKLMSKMLRLVFLNSAISFSTNSDTAPFSVPTTTQTVQDLIFLLREGGRSLSGSVPSLSRKHEYFFWVRSSASPV